MKHFILAIILLFSPVAFGSSAVNPANTGNLGGYQGTGWTAYTPTFSNLGTVTLYTAEYRRNGPDLQVRISLTTGTCVAAEARMTLPTGLITKATISSGVNAEVAGISWASANTSGIIAPAIQPSKAYIVFLRNVNPPMTVLNGNNFFDSTVYTFYATIPIEGWGAGGSNPSGVAARYHASSTSISGTLATVVWTTSDWDTNGAMSSGVFTCPQTGKYQVNAFLGISGTFALNSTTSMELQVNSTAVATKTEYAGGIITNADIGISDVVSCAAITDTVRIQVSSSATGPAIVSSNVKNWISISKVSN